MSDFRAFSPSEQQGLQFLSFLVRTGRIGEGMPPRCVGCGEYLVWPPFVSIALLEMGEPINPRRCDCGTLSLLSEGVVIPSELVELVGVGAA